MRDTIKIVAAEAARSALPGWASLGHQEPPATPSLIFKEASAASR